MDITNPPVLEILNNYNIKHFSISYNMRISIFPVLARIFKIIKTGYCISSNYQFY